MSTLAEAIEAKRGLPYGQILSELKEETVDVVGTIEGDDLRDVVTVLCSGLEHRLLTAPDSPTKTALVRAFNSMSIQGFGFNLTHPLVIQMLDSGVAEGLIDVNERLWFYGIATKQVPKYPDVTLRDVISHFEPEAIDGEWHELDVTNAQTFVMRLTTAAPTQTYIVIQMQDQYGDGSTSDWYHAQSLHGLTAAREWTATVPHNGYPRKLRWKCEYQLSGTVAVR